MCWSLALINMKWILQCNIFTGFCTLHTFYTVRLLAVWECRSVIFCWMVGGPLASLWNTILETFQILVNIPYSSSYIPPKPQRGKVNRNRKNSFKATLWIQETWKRTCNSKFLFSFIHCYKTEGEIPVHTHDDAGRQRSTTGKYFPYGNGTLPEFSRDILHGKK